MMHWFEFSAWIETVYSFSGVISVLMSDVTLTFLFPLIDVKVVFLNPGLSSPLFILIYLFSSKEKKVNLLCLCGHRKFFLHRLRLSYNTYAIVTAKIQRCSERKPTAFAPNVRTFAAEVSVLNGDHNMFEFDVDTNIGNKVGLTIIFEVYVE